MWQYNPSSCALACFVLANAGYHSLSIKRLKFFIYIPFYRQYLIKILRASLIFIAKYGEPPLSGWFSNITFRYRSANFLLVNAWALTLACLWIGCTQFLLLQQPRDESSYRWIHLLGVQIVILLWLFELFSILGLDKHLAEPNDQERIINEWRLNT